MAKKIDDGGPAFPTCLTDWCNGNGGMSLRDYFAAKVMAGSVSRDAAKDWTDENVATWAYETADAMLAERAKGK